MAVGLATSSSNCMEGCGQACTPLLLVPFRDDYHKKLIGIFLPNIDWHNHIYLLRNIFHLFVAINFDTAII